MFRYYSEDELKLLEGKKFLVKDWNYKVLKLKEGYLSSECSLTYKASSVLIVCLGELMDKTFLNTKYNTSGVFKGHSLTQNTNLKSYVGFYTKELVPFWNSVDDLFLTH